ncbi:MAG: type IV pilin N-terminal domain-containing protein [Methanoregula sp.]|nr:type IV pilin N-terminal domain-containing protein [Methanoregula sp.]
MAFTKKNEDAVSPVIGVILMVAITVILAAVIAAFVFGMAGNISKTKTVAFTVQRTGATTVVITNNGGQDVSTLSSVVISAGAVTNGAISTAVGSTGAFAAGPGPAHVIVTGTFTDGTSQVLLDTNV